MVRPNDAGVRPFMVVAVDVCVLGPVEVRGAAGLFRRSAALELVVYLAFHRRPVRHGEWALALWPDRSVSTATIYSTSSDARRALGRDGAGDERLPRNGGHLVLSADVGTDAARFEALASSGRPADLVEAMALVRGPIFAGLRRTDWAVFDGTESSLQSLVADTALRAADLLVGLGRAGQAERMVRRALLACPYDERLYRSLLRAAAAQGNRVGLRSTLAQLLVLAGDEVRAAGLPAARPGAAVLSCLHPDTTALYQELLGATPAPGGHIARL
jgi:DNA-binding SARP family transcriptional activator